MPGPDDIELRERRFRRAAEPSWALWQVLRAAVDAGHAMAERLQLPYNDVRALEMIAQAEVGFGPVELGDRLGMRSASATELVHRLEASGYVRRSRHPTDRRRIVLELTEQGRRDVLAALEPLLDRLDRVAAGIDAQASAAVVAYLRAVATEQLAYCRDDPAT
jgi:DNA-binding MarR family transcriptional regulator